MINTEKKRLMRTRKRISQKRPHFARFESWRFVRLGDKWRKPKGVDNHMRIQNRGWPKIVKPGYGGPRAVKGLHPSGYEEVMVYNVGDLSLIEVETQAARIGGSVGTKKRVAILTEALDQGIKVLNPGRALDLVEKKEETEEDKKEADAE